MGPGEKDFSSQIHVPCRGDLQIRGRDRNVMVLTDMTDMLWCSRPSRFLNMKSLTGFSGSGSTWLQVYFMPIKVQKLGKNAQALGSSWAAPKWFRKKVGCFSQELSTFSHVQPASWDVRCQHLYVIAPLKITSTFHTWNYEHFKSLLPTWKGDVSAQAPIGKIVGWAWSIGASLVQPEMITACLHHVSSSLKFSTSTIQVLHQNIMCGDIVLVLVSSRMTTISQLTWDCRLWRDLIRVKSTDCLPLA